jgi:hypothetical protein
MGVENIYEAETSVTSSPKARPMLRTLVELEKAALVQIKKHEVRAKHLWRQNELQEPLRQIQCKILEEEYETSGKISSATSRLLVSHRHSSKYPRTSARVSIRN